MLKELFAKIPEPFHSDTLFIIQTYMDAGYECYIVGGPNRDLINGLIPKDIDLSTNCPLEVTNELFDHVLPTGESHGTLSIHINGENYEVTRYRFDTETDGRHAKISFADDFDADSDRRDFTMNSIGFNPITGEVRDPNNGLEDIKNGIIRFVGNAEDRIAEDQLRVLRLLRFIVRFDHLGFTVEREDLELALKLYKNDVVSVERIYQELEGMFKVIENDRSTVEFITRTLKSLNLFRRFTTDKLGMDTAVDRMFDTLDFFPLVMMLDGDNQTLRLGHEYKHQFDLFKRFMNEDLSDIVTVKDLLEATDGDFEVAQSSLSYFKVFNSSNSHEDGLIALRALKNKELKGEGEPFKVTHLELKGKDFMDAGLKGPDIGKAQKKLLQIVKAKPFLNTKEKLLEMV